VIIARVIFDDTITSAAVREALHDRGVYIAAFPPADGRQPATSVIGTALSEELKAAGVVVATTETLVMSGIDFVRERLPDDQHPTVDEIEGQLWPYLDPILDPDGAVTEDDLNSPLGPLRASASRVFDADVLVTTDVALLKMGRIGKLVAIDPVKWLDQADSIVRQHRRSGDGPGRGNDQPGTAPRH